MTWSFRRSFVVLLALLMAISTAWLDHGRAQLVQKTVEVPVAQTPADGPQVGMNPDGFLNSGISLPKDEKGRKKAIEAANDYIREEKWDIAVPHLQKLLEIDEDVFVRLTRKNAEGKDVLTWVSVKQEADRLLGTLPAAGLDFYKLTYGAKAAEMLKKAKQNGDYALLADLMKKYGHTDAGAEAIKLLADYHLDRGNSMPALLCYSKLISRQGPDKVSPLVLAKAAQAAHGAPPSSSSQNTILAGNVYSEKELWRLLRNRTREVTFGDRAVGVDELEEYVAKLDRPNFNLDATDAVVYRATPNRGNQLVGGPAFMTANWRRSMMYEEEKENPEPAKRIKQATDYWTGTRKQPIIPAFAPITVTVTRGEQKIPLLVYRNYWGIVAQSLKKVTQSGMTLKEGDIAWASPSNWSLERLLHRSSDQRKSQPMNQWLDYYVGQNGGGTGQQPQILFENSTVGTLSTDGQYVYAVEDLAVPPPPHTVNMGNMGFNPNIQQNNSYPPEMQEAINHNRLQAFSLATNGKLTWELGDPGEKGPLADCYFLGPPLPLAGKLYVLIEKQQELRLVCLDPDNRGAIVSTQTLGTSQDKMQNDVLRRTTAAHLAYGEGILVCPTNAGAVFGINLLENSLVWAYPYREKSDNKPPQDFNMQQIRMIRRGGGIIVGPNGQPIQATPHHNQWKASAPVIADGKVVFTAPDARSIHCVNLRDGSPVWHKPKQEDDLYLGNVYNGKVLIVGKSSVRGLSLSTGEILWTLPTGMPSGQGIGSDNVYYLPLKEAGRSKEPQICAIDMERGKVVGTTPSHPRTPGGNDYDVPGNLLFYEGEVISLTPTEVVVYPQIKVKIAQMDELIAKNPNDPVGLTERGDLRLAKNDLPGAIEDLSTALKNNPDKDTRARARAKLYDTLTAYITDHFNDAEKYLPEYEELCNIDMDGAKDEKDRKERQDEQRRRRATYLWLVGKGREEQGRLVEAFEKYQEFAGVAGKQQELVPAVDERQVKAAPDVWSRGRIVAMMAKAKPEHREPLEKLIADKWEQLRQTNDLDALRQFVRMFGSVSAAGKEARLQLVDRLMEQKEGTDEHPLLEAELELNQFRTGEHGPELAARATEALARLYTRKGLLEDAAYCYRRLGSDYPDVIIRDGKTGRDFYNDTATDKRLLPYLDEPDPFGSTRLKGALKNEGVRPPDNGQLFQFEHSGEDLPFFRTHIVGLTMGQGNQKFKLLDRTQPGTNSGEPFKEVWSHTLTPTMFQMLASQVLGQNQMNQFNQFANMGGMGGIAVNANNAAGSPPREPHFPYRTLGHLVVLPACNMVFGIDPVNRRVLWEKDLAPITGPIGVKRGQPNGLNPQHPPVVDPRDGSVVVTYLDGWAQRLGQAGSLQGRALCVQARETLTVLDPLTGRTLWTRMDVYPHNHLFADDNHIFVVELDHDNAPSGTRVFRADDGITVKVADFSAVFKKRQQTFGRFILVSEAGAAGGVQLRLYDPLAARDVWKQTYAARSIVARSEDDSLAGVVEPSGKVHVIDLRARKEVMTGQMADPARDLQEVQVVHLLADAKNFYFACQAPMELNNMNRGMPTGIMSNVMTQLGMRTVAVNGMIYAFKRDTGEYDWYVPAKNQMLVLDQFRGLPVIPLTARKQDFQNFTGRASSNVYAMSIEKRSGKVIFADDNLNAQNFWGVRVDNRAGTIDFLSYNARITHSPLRPEDKDGKSAAEASATQGAQANPEAADGELKIRRKAVDRVRIREIVPPG
jgi:outer membrane protein assembly factor BamB/tetratricopeptide (TPR) repeat protein